MDGANYDEFLPPSDGLPGELPNRAEKESKGDNQTLNSEKSQLNCAAPSVAVVLQDEACALESKALFVAGHPLLVRHRHPKRPKSDEGEALVSLNKSQLVQEGIRCEEERENREEERYMMREIQEAELQRHERPMEMMMMEFCSGAEESEGHS